MTVVARLKPGMNDAPGAGGNEHDRERAWNSNIQTTTGIGERMWCRCASRSPGSSGRLS